MSVFSKYRDQVIDSALNKAGIDPGLREVGNAIIEGLNRTGGNVPNPAAGAGSNDARPSVNISLAAASNPYLIIAIVILGGYVAYRSLK